MEEILLSKIITLEVIVETLLDELINNGMIDKESYDVAVSTKITILQNKLKKMQKEEFDYSNLLKGPIGKA
jgi:hypothetical protein